MDKLSSCTTVNFWFRPIGFPSKKSTPTVSQISRWDKDEKPNHFKSISPICLAGELFALIGGISSVFGFSKDNKYAKWGGVASILAGIAMFITAIFKGPVKTCKASEETSKSLKTITDEKDDTNRKKMIDDLIAQNNSDDLLQTLKNILADNSNTSSTEGVLEIISHLSNGHALILDIVKDKTYNNYVRRAAIVAIKNTGEEERKVLISILKDEREEPRDVACCKLGEFSDQESYDLLFKLLKDKRENRDIRFNCLWSISKRKQPGYIEDLAKLLEEKGIPEGIPDLYKNAISDAILKDIIKLPVGEIKTHVLEVLSTDSKLSIDELKTLESNNDEKYAHLLFNSLSNENISYLSKLMIYDALVNYIVDKELTKEFAKTINESLLLPVAAKTIYKDYRKFPRSCFQSRFEYLKDCPLSESNIKSIKLYKDKGWLAEEEKIKDS